MKTKKPFKTIFDSTNYYNKNALYYFQNTKDLDLENLYQPFLSLIPTKGKILDAGCGSGRDSLYFKSKGYSVVSFDNSRELVNLASSKLGDNVLLMSFQDVNFEDEFDGIWSCASLLHVSKSEIDSVFNRLAKALKTNGILYASFKYGDCEIVNDERLFNYYDESTFSLLIDNQNHLEIIEMWQTEDIRKDRKNEFWLNVLLKKR